MATLIQLGKSVGSPRGPYENCVVMGPHRPQQAILVPVALAPAAATWEQRLVRGYWRLGPQGPNSCSLVRSKEWLRHACGK